MTVTVVWGRLSISLVRDVAGDPLYLVAMVEDISQRERRRRRSVVTKSSFNLWHRSFP